MLEAVPPLRPRGQRVTPPLPPTVHRQLSFFARGELVERVLWDGPWPPERELLRCVGRTTGATSITTRARVAERGLDMDTVAAHARVTEFHLIHATDLLATYHESL